MVNVIRELYLVITANGVWIHSRTTLDQTLARYSSGGTELEFPPAIPGIDHGVNGALGVLPVRIEDAKLAPGQMIILPIKEMIIPHLKPATYVWREL